MRFLMGLAALAAFCLPASVAAQDDSNARILATVDTFFEGLNTKNPELMASVALAGAGLSSLIEAEEEDRIRAQPLADTIARLTADESTFNEVYWDPIVLVQGPIAVVWAPYSFDTDGVRSHCGIDVFNLLRVDDEWKISGLHFTMDPDGCPEGR